MKPKIVFLHIPKCAGTSLRHAIGSAWEVSDPGSVVRIETRPSFTAAGMVGMSVQAFREHLLLYFMADSRYRFISGHMSFSETAHRRFSDEWEFIILLRHPVTRWLSHYHFDRFKQDSHTKISLDLDQFLKTERARQLGSEYVSRLAPREANVGVSSEAAIAEARQNLAKFSLIGVTERLDLYREEFKKRYGSPITLSRVNASPAPDLLQQSLDDEEICSKVEELCQPDMLVYQYALAQLG